MKTKRNRPQNAFDRLDAAATEILNIAVKAFEEAGQPVGDLYLPIIIGGTDRRIAIESGPSIAASNAIHQAQGRAGQAPTMTHNDAVRKAADLLAAHAESLKESHTVGGAWPDDNDAREHYDNMLTVIDGLKRGR